VVRDLGHVAEQDVKFIGGDLQDLTELRPKPGLRLSLTALPADDGGALTPQT
jgi:hypothetical protein